MSEHDDDDDGPPPAGFLIPLGQPPTQEQIEAYKQQADLAQMAAEAERHEILSMVKSMDVDTMVTFRRFMVEVNSEEMRYYWIGVLTTLLEVQHGKCAGCGKNHDEELLTAQQEVHGDE